jgi:hypothetical protein
MTTCARASCQNSGFIHGFCAPCWITLDPSVKNEITASDPSTAGSRRRLRMASYLAPYRAAVALAVR